MNIEKDILLEEKELKPNKCTAKAMLWVMLGAVCIELLNEIGVFHVKNSAMRVSMLVVVLVAILIQICGQLPQIAERHATKYGILLLVMLEVLLVTTVLAQWGEMVIILPLLLALQYHNKKVTLFCFAGTVLIAMLAAPLNCLLGLAQVNYYTYLVGSCGYTVGSVMPDPDYDRIRCALEIFRYTGVSRGIIAAGIGTIAFYITKLDAANIEERVIATVYCRIDALTGICNRFSFEEKLKAYEENPPEELICVYADADDLHNVNKVYGHDTGDQFLKFCSSQLVHNFGEYTYRIGGDEFLAFVEHGDVERCQERIDRIQRVLDENGYHMSFGICKLEDDMPICELVSAAEKKMYMAKGEHYVTSGKDRRKN